MNFTRRSFIKNNTLALSGMALFPKILSATADTSTLTGVQLYIVRKDMKKDPVATLKKLKSQGYKDVEHAGYENRKFYGYTPEDFKKLLNDIGLEMVSGHSYLGGEQWDKSKNDFTDEWKYTFEDAAKVGMKFVLSPGLDESLCKNEDDFKWYMELFNKTGELSKKSGITFGYHNETAEFAQKLNGTILYDLLLQLTNPDTVTQQIDIGNMYPTGGRAMDYLKKYPGRFMLMHVKDMKKKSSGEGYENTPLGTGVVGVKDIVDYAKKTGMKYFIIEENAYDGKTPLECAGESLGIMKSWGY